MITKHEIRCTVRKIPLVVEYEKEEENGEIYIMRVFLKCDVEGSYDLECHLSNTFLSEIEKMIEMCDPYEMPEIKALFAELYNFCR